MSLAPTALWASSPPGKGAYPYPSVHLLTTCAPKDERYPRGEAPPPLATSRPGPKNGPRTSTGDVQMSGNVPNRYNPQGMNQGMERNRFNPGARGNAPMDNMPATQYNPGAVGNDAYGGNPPEVAKYGTNLRGMPQDFFGVQQGDVVTLNGRDGVNLIENGAYRRTDGYGRGYVKPNLNKNGVTKRVQGYGYSPGGVAQIFFTDGTIAQD